jgi:hypothetical protein
MASAGQKYGISGSQGSGWTFNGDVRGNLNSGPGRHWFVNTAAASGGEGRTWDTAFSTMAAALLAVADNDTIHWVGDVREQLVAPLGVQGVRIVAEAVGQNRHDDGCRWRVPASTVAGKALLEIREQGWEIIGGLMVPDATAGACVKAHRNEDATYPDGSHFVARRVKFVGAGGYGIQDVGGCHHALIENCEFNDLAAGIICTSTAIAIPLRWTIRDNAFEGNTNDIAMSLSKSVIKDNTFLTAGSGATNKVISTTYVSTQGGNNTVAGNVFNNTEVQIAPGNGFTGASTDNWTGNLVNNQAAFAFGQPA